MRDVWDKRRKGSRSRPARPRLVRRLAASSATTRHRPPKGATSVRTWVFSKRQAASPPERQLLVKRTKEPAVDLFDEQDELIVLADLPGVSEDDIRITVEGDLLIIEAVSTGPRGEVHYYKEVMLPYEVREDYERSCNRGVLEVHVRPKRRAGGRAGTAPGRRGSSASAVQPSKRKKRRRRKNGGGKDEKNRKG